MEKTTGTLSKTEMERRDRVCNKLARDLDRLLGNYRTDDKKPLTEGEVIVGVGFLLGQHVKSRKRAAAWLQQIGVATLEATKEE